MRAVSTAILLIPRYISILILSTRNFNGERKIFLFCCWSVDGMDQITYAIWSFVNQASATWLQQNVLLEPRGSGLVDKWTARAAIKVWALALSLSLSLSLSFSLYIYIYIYTWEQACRNFGSKKGQSPMEPLAWKFRGPWIHGIINWKGYRCMPAWVLVYHQGQVVRGKWSVVRGKEPLKLKSEAGVWTNKTENLYTFWLSTRIEGTIAPYGSVTAVGCTLLEFWNIWFVNLIL